MMGAWSTAVEEKSDSFQWPALKDLKDLYTQFGWPITFYDIGDYHIGENYTRPIVVQFKRFETPCKSQRRVTG